MTRRPHKAAAVMLAVYAVWQLSAIVHLSLEGFEPCGHVGSDDHAHDSEAPTSPNPDPDPADNGCPVLAQLTNANALKSHPFLEIATVQLVGLTPIDSQSSFSASGRELFRVSPANSPPPVT